MPIDLPTGRSASIPPAGWSTCSSGRRAVARAAGPVVGCAVGVADGDRARRSPRRPGGPTSPTRPTWSRRWSASTGTTTCRACCRSRPPGRGLTAAQRRRRSVGRALAEAGLRRGAVATRSSAPDAGRPLGLPADDPRRQRGAAGQPAVRGGAAAAHHAAAAAARHAARNLGRGQRDVALYEIGAVFRPRPAPARRRRMGVDRPARRRGVRRRRRGGAGASRGTSPRCWPASSSRPAGGAPGRPAGWADAVEAARDVLAAAGHPRASGSTVRAAERAPVAPGPVRRLLVDGVVVGHAGELHPAVCAALELPRRTCAMELDLDALPRGAGDARRRRSPASRRR